jgi:putative AdoMet-dependent methyltransferase
MSRSEELARRWNQKEYVANYLRVMAAREYDGTEWARELGLTEQTTVLDLGCGDGRILLAIASSIHRGIGIDVSEHQIAAARRNAEAAQVSNVEFIQSDFRHFDIGPERVDVVITIAAFHHISNEEKAALLSRVSQVLKPGGLFYFDDDTFNFPPEQFEQRAAEIRQEWERRFGSEGYERLKRELCFDDFELTPYLSDLQRMIEAAGLPIEATQERGLHGAEIRAHKAVSTPVATDVARGNRDDARGHH